MENATKKILHALRAHGCRITIARERIVSVLARQHQPQTTKEIATKVSADEASVYRTIQLLREAGLLEEIPVAGQRPRFSLAHGHHHHIVCDSCGRVAHIPCGNVAPPKTLPEEFVRVEDHEVTFHGLCKSCA